MTSAASPSRARIDSIDIVRGAVMVLMAIDHVRVYSGLPAGGPTPGIFFTRWITHFCAPVFIFLAGTGAYLYGQKHQDKAALSRFLVTRGAWLVFLELTVLRFGWTFNFDYAHYMLAGVIWCIGWCMILLGTLVWLPTKVVGAFGVVVIAGHNLFDHFASQIVPELLKSSGIWFWQILYLGGPVKLGADGPTLAVLYSIIPWIGVMAAGYAFGAVMLLEPARRNRICFRVGFGAMAAFLVLRGFNLYGNPTPWGGPQSRVPALLSFLNTNKYPASLQFLLMTLGPMFLVIPPLEHARGRIAGALTILGRVPFSYYVLHIPLIHFVALGVSLVRFGGVEPWLFANHPMMNPLAPPGYTWPLWLLYLVWAAVVVVLYFACRWLAGVKERRRDWWLSFV